MQEIDEVFSSDGDDDMPIIAESTVKIDDGGSNLTDRFKYKVSARTTDFLRGRKDEK